MSKYITMPFMISFKNRSIFKSFVDILCPLTTIWTHYTVLLAHNQRLILVQFVSAVSTSNVTLCYVLVLPSPKKSTQVIASETRQGRDADQLGKVSEREGKRD